MANVVVDAVGQFWRPSMQIFRRGTFKGQYGILRNGEMTLI